MKRGMSLETLVKLIVVSAFVIGLAAIFFKLSMVGK